MKTKYTPDELRANAAKTEEEYVRRDFTEDEMISFKDDIAKLSIHTYEKEGELKEISRELKNEIKGLKSEIRTHLGNVKAGYRENFETVFLIEDFTKGVMEYWTCDGDLIRSRKLRPEENQLRIDSNTAINE